MPGKVSATTYGATPADWTAFQRLGLTADLLPVVCNVDAPINTAVSKLKAVDCKTPSKVTAGGVVGVAGWADRTTTAHEIKRWAAEPDHGIGLVGRRVKAIDIDIADPVRAAEVEDLLMMLLGRLPCRGRSNSGKRLLVFSLSGALPKRVIKTTHGIVELLGDRQQFLLAGAHKTGVRYEWAGGLPGEIPVLTTAEVDMAWQALISAFGTPGGDSTDRPPTTLDRPRNAADADDPTVAWLAENGWVTGYAHDGRVFVRCPNEAEHNPDAGDDTSTAYIPAGVGQATYGFRCKHAHCAHITPPLFLRLTGSDDPVNDFELVVLSEDQVTESARAVINNTARRGAALDDFHAYAPDHRFIHRPRALCGQRRRWTAWCTSGPR